MAISAFVTRFSAPTGALAFAVLVAACGEVVEEQPDSGELDCEEGWAGPDCDECVSMVAGEDGDDGAGGGSWEQALARPQAGVARAAARVRDGDAARCSVWVREGTYTPGDQRDEAFELAPGVHLYGGFAGDETARGERDAEENETIFSGDIDADGDLEGNAYHVVIGADDALIDGFTIMAGNADGDRDAGNAGGGGMRVVDTSPTLANLTFADNSASRDGGALWIDGDASPSLDDLRFRDNKAALNGGALFISGAATPTLTEIAFSGNAAGGSGGALRVEGEASAEGEQVSFSENSADGGGGALSVSGGASMTIERASLSANSAAASGGAVIASSSGFVALRNARLVANAAGSRGGGMSAVAGGEIAAQNALLYDNEAEEGTAMSAATQAEPSAVTLTNATIARNEPSTASAIVTSNAEGVTSLEVRNSIVWDNAQSEIEEIATDGAGTAITHSLVAGGEPDGVDEWVDSFGDDEQAHNPRFIEASAGNFRLLSNSPAIDRGNSQLADIPDEDLDGNPRIVDGAGDGEAVIDLGAYEYQP